MKGETVRILVPLERGESAREPARLLGGLFAPAAIRARALHVGSVAVPLFYFPSGPGALGSLRREHLAWEEKARRALKSQVGPLEDAGFAVEVEVTAIPRSEKCSSARSSGGPTSSWHAHGVGGLDREGSGVSRRG